MIEQTSTVNVEEFRTIDGVEEHKHDSRPYWHPAARVHNDHIAPAEEHTINHTQTEWANKDLEYDVLMVIEGQTHYVNLFGEYIDLPSRVWDVDVDQSLYDWVTAMSEIIPIQMSLQMYGGCGVGFRIDANRGSVEFTENIVTFEEGTVFQDVMILLESGIAANYISLPDFEDAMHILHVSGGDRYYDLIRLPSGGHIPVDILEKEYGVSWETIARIPLGMPRDDETFSCPICGEKSYFSGACNRCIYETDKDGVLIVSSEDIENEYQEKECRKERKHGEILRLIKSGNWKQCRYMRG